MEDKKGFLLYTSFFEQIQKLSVERRGVLLTAIMCYQLQIEMPEMDELTDMVFSMIRQKMDADQEKYKKTCEARSRAGKLGGRPKAKGFEEEAKKANVFFENQTEAKKADNDNEDDNDIEEKTPKGVKKKSESFSPPTLDDINGYCLEKNIDIDQEKFFDFYESKGWMIGKNKMKDWRAAVRNWSRSQRQEGATEGKGGKTVISGNRFNNFRQRNYDFEKLENQLLEC